MCRLVAYAIARYVVRGEDARKGVLIGYDHRQFADRTAAEIADVFQRDGNTRLAGGQALPNAGHFTAGAATRRGGGHRCHCQSQSIRVEWDQIQGELWQQRAPIHRVPNREGTGRRVCVPACARCRREGT